MYGFSGWLAIIHWNLSDYSVVCTVILVLMQYMVMADNLPAKNFMDSLSPGRNWERQTFKLTKWNCYKEVDFDFNFTYPVTIIDDTIKKGANDK